MRTSLVNGFLVVVYVAMFGSGCSTLHRWWYGPDKKPVAMTPTNVPPEPVPLGATSLLDANETNTAELATSAGVFSENRTVDPSVTFEAVHFAYDSFLVPPQEIAKITQVGQYLLENSSRVTTVDGHCDERGSNEYNLSLGEQRAQAVRKCLIDLGIDAARIQTRSFGKEKPLDPGHSESAWARNRRGEFVVYK